MGQELRKGPGETETRIADCGRLCSCSARPHGDPVESSPTSRREDYETHYLRLSMPSRRWAHHCNYRASRSSHHSQTLPCTW